MIKSNASTGIATISDNTENTDNTGDSKKIDTKKDIIIGAIAFILFVYLIVINIFYARKTSERISISNVNSVIFKNRDIFEKQINAASRDTYVWYEKRADGNYIQYVSSNFNLFKSKETNEFVIALILNALVSVIAVGLYAYLGIKWYILICLSCVCIVWPIYFLKLPMFIQSIVAICVLLAYIIFAVKLKRISGMK